MQSYSVRDLLRTAVEHISHQIARAVSMQCSMMNEACQTAAAAAAAKSTRPLRLLATGLNADFKFIGMLSSRGQCEPNLMVSLFSFFCIFVSRLQECKRY